MIPTPMPKVIWSSAQFFDPTGKKRQRHIERLKEVFGLADVIWIEANRNQSYTACEADIARPDVAIVLLRIASTKHEYGKVNAYCQKYETPIVRVQAGYNPNQIAVDILKQASDRLG